MAIYRVVYIFNDQGGSCSVDIEASGEEAITEDAGDLVLTDGDEVTGRFAAGRWVACHVVDDDDDD